MMRFFLDHDVPADVGRVLRSAGYSVAMLKERLDPTTSDAEVFDFAIREAMVLVTCNRDDFLQLAKEREFPGLIILIRRRTRQQECAHLLRLIENAGEAGVAGNILFA
jgi:predicted nuclease of predicted toxin-antitoxin system